MEQIKWIDRKFQFGYEKGYLPFLMERLRGTGPRLEELLNSCPEVVATVRQLTEWSVKQHACHITDLDGLNNRRIDDFIAGADVLAAADMTNKATNDQQHDEKHIPQIIKEFRESRHNFLKKIEALDPVYFDRTAIHPRLQQAMSIADLLYFIAEHDTHHLTQIERLSRASAMPI